MYKKPVAIVKKAIFPIFRLENVTSQGQSVGVVGTGFFINSEGYFVSVAHVFDNPGQNISFSFLGHLPDYVENPQYIIREIARDDNADIFIGKIDKPNTDFIKLNGKETGEGMSICISGYPLANISVTQQGEIQLGGVRRYFQPSFILDKINMNSLSNGITRLHEGFLVRDVGLFGMSGGPVFDRSGKLVGMQGSVASRTSTNGTVTITVDNAMVIKSRKIKELLKANNIRFNESFLFQKSKKKLLGIKGYFKNILSYQKVINISKIVNTWASKIKKIR